MSAKFRLPFLILGILLLNVAIYFRATYEVSDSNLFYAECARNAGRTSAAINLVLLFLCGYYGLKKIFLKPTLLYWFRILFTLFAVNHLIHFYFVFHNFKDNPSHLGVSHHIHGFLTFVFILIIPILLWSIKKINGVIYAVIITHLINVTYFISITFYGRYKPEDPAYLHRIGILIMIVMVIFVGFRIVEELLSRES